MDDSTFDYNLKTTLFSLGVVVCFKEESADIATK
jgi:hypothetical protein